jgi:uncharacterized protein YabE (DUF348 family)
VPGRQAKVRASRSTRWSRLPALLLYALILAALGGGAVAYAAFDKTVHVSVDGQSRTVHTFAQTVGGVLDKAGVHTNVHDLVEPDTSAHVNDGGQVKVVHGRQLHLVLDGRQTVVWVTAATVEQALAELGLTERGTYVSASMSRPVPLSGLGLVVRVPHDLTVLHDATSTRLKTTAATVREALVAAKVRLGKSDTISVPLQSMPRDGQIISITRVSQSSVSVTQAIPFATKRVADNTMYKGKVNVVAPGRVGVLVKRYALTRVNGAIHQRRLMSRTVLRKPEARVVHIGTKPRPKQSGNVGDEKVDNLNWYALAGCESNHDPHAYSPGGPYYGLYQFSQGSWELVGGKGDPREASSSEQTYRAKRLYMRSGDGNWPTCGHYLYE